MANQDKGYSSMIFDARVPIITVKKSITAFYKHASIITIHLMLDTNTSIYSLNSLDA
jgi:hypothetical protein